MTFMLEPYTFSKISKLDFSWILDLLFITFSFADMFLKTLHESKVEDVWSFHFLLTY